MIDGILLSKCSMQAMKNGNLSLYRRVYEKKIQFSILMYWSKNVACAPLCSSFSSNSPGYMPLKDFENLPSLVIVKRSSANRLVAWYLYALYYFLETRFWTSNQSWKSK